MTVSLASQAPLMQVIMLAILDFTLFACFMACKAQALQTGRDLSHLSKLWEDFKQKNATKLNLLRMT